MKKRQLKQEWQVALVGLALTFWIIGGMALMGYLEQIWNIRP